MSSIKRKQESFEFDGIHLIKLRRRIESIHQDSNGDSHGCKIEFLFEIGTFSGLPEFFYIVERVCGVGEDVCEPDDIFNSGDLDTDDVIIGEPYETIGMPDIDSLRMYDLPREDRKRIYNELQSFVDTINDLVIGSMGHTDVSSFSGRARFLQFYKGIDISIARFYIIDAWVQVVHENAAALRRRGIDVIMV